MVASLFPLGRTVITPGALAVCTSFPMPPEILLVRHLMGDWSDMGKEDEATNWQSIDDASRILSAYQVGSHRFYVITEADRETTTILLAEEY